MPRLRAQAGWFSVVRLSFAHEVADGDADQEDERAQESSGHRIPGGQLLARVVTLTVVTSFVVVVALELVETPQLPFALSIGMPCLVVMFALLVWVISEVSENWPVRRRLAVLAVEGLIAYLPLIPLGTLWSTSGLAGFFAGSAMLLLAGWVAWAVFAATVGSMLVGGLIGLALSEITLATVAYQVLLTLVVGLVVFGLARLSLLIKYVHARRGELAQLAVISERMRFARDLHDLLGYSLSAITLKAEFTRRLIGTNPGRARDELAEVLDIARQALADVRIVASGYRNISLAKEASSVNSLLAAAGIDAQVDINCGMLDEKLDTVLATVLREAITNMLRHSTARHCTIEASLTGDTVSLQVANDGAARAAPSAHRGGLDNLSSRMASIGGHITAQVRDDGWFTVHAQAPLTPRLTSGQATGGSASRVEGD
jgi:two-component system sensor histidine kinase DesK